MHAHYLARMLQNIPSPNVKTQFNVLHVTMDKFYNVLSQTRSKKPPILYLDNLEDNKCDIQRNKIFVKHLKLDASMIHLFKICVPTMTILKVKNSRSNFF